MKNPYTGGMTNPATYLNTLWDQAGIPNNTEQFFVDALNSYDVINKTSSVFIMGDVGDSVYHANFGVRVVHNQLNVAGGQTNPSGSTFVGTASWNGVNANDIPFENSRSYTDVLPTFNFVLDATDQQKIRFGAARVLSPQNLQRPRQRPVVQFHSRRSPGLPGRRGVLQVRSGHRGQRQPRSVPRHAGASVMGRLLCAERSGERRRLLQAGGQLRHAGKRATLVPDGTIAGGSVGNVATLVNGGSGKVYGVEFGAQYAFATASASRQTTRARIPNRRRAVPLAPICRSRAYRRTPSTPSATSRGRDSRHAWRTPGVTSR